MISHRILLAVCFASACSATFADASSQASTPTRARLASGPGLLLASPTSGGFFASGQRSTFRVLNPSSDQALGPVSAKAMGQTGFKVESNTCSKGLAPRSQCTLVVAWHPLSPGVSRSELVVSSSPSMEVRSSLTGDTDFLTR